MIFYSWVQVPNSLTTLCMNDNKIIKIVWGTNVFFMFEYPFSKIFQLKTHYMEQNVTIIYFLTLRVLL